MSEAGQRTLRKSEFTPARDPSRPAAHLFLVLECERPLAGGSRHAIGDVDQIVVGRGAARGATRDGRSLTIRVPDPLMSSTHARIVREGDGFAIEDSGSTNGTFVDGKRVARQTLSDGALIDLGATLFTIRTSLATPASTPVDIDSARLAGHEYGLATLLPEYAVALRKLAEIALSGVFILLLGETGTGKEVLARGVHAISGRPGDLVPVNCGAIPETLVESQLFGHTRGAFSGATRDEPGYVRASHRGTLFLDEVGDLPKTSQAALLRVLQEHEVTSVGATRAVPVDLRVVAATHRPVASLVSDGSFRADLFARLAGYTHELLPLRARKEDLGILVTELLPRVAGKRAASLKIDLDLARALYRHDWPMNVRELQHALSSAAVFAKDGPLHAAHLPDAMRSTIPVKAPARSGPVTAADAAIKAQLTSALEAHSGNVSEVARLMKTTRMQVHRWMRRFGIDAESFRCRAPDAAVEHGVRRLFFVPHAVQAVPHSASGGSTP